LVTLIFFHIVLLLISGILLFLPFLLLLSELCLVATTSCLSLEWTTPLIALKIGKRIIRVPLMVVLISYHLFFETNKRMIVPGIGLFTFITIVKIMAYCTFISYTLDWFDSASITGKSMMNSSLLLIGFFKTRNFLFFVSFSKRFGKDSWFFIDFNIILLHLASLRLG